MFSKNTVFIVGAGGSKELGLPVGEQLKGAIANKVNIAFQDGIKLASGDVNILDAVRRDLGRQQKRDGNPYWSAGRKIASAMPQALSIDNFLHTHSDDENIVLMGKLGIAACILNAERNSLIYTDPNSSQRHPFSNSALTWHNTFCKMLTEGVQRRNIDDIFKNVSFITFNYDRCIEHYTAMWLQNYFQLSETEAQGLVNGMAIIHPYGQVGQLPWQKKGMIPVSYGSDIYFDRIIEIAANIRTFTEQIEDKTEIEKARQIIADAQQIVYLGFSFGSMNMELLKIESCHIFKQVYDTVLGISGPNVRVIEQSIHKCIASGGNTMTTRPELADVSSFQLLENYYRVLTSSN